MVWLGRHSGRGVVVGLLKVGSKKLFVYDSNGAQHELQPLCVLDFYVHESCQRRGYGRKLFEFMLQVPSAFQHALVHLKGYRPFPCAHSKPEEAWHHSGIPSICSIVLAFVASQPWSAINRG